MQVLAKILAVVLVYLPILAIVVVQWAVPKKVIIVVALSIVHFLPVKPIVICAISVLGLSLVLVLVLPMLVTLSLPKPPVKTKLAVPGHRVVIPTPTPLSSQYFLIQFLVLINGLLSQKRLPRMAEKFITNFLMMMVVVGITGMVQVGV